MFKKSYLFSTICNCSDFGLNRGMFDLADRDITNGKSQGGQIEYNDESGQKLNSYEKNQLTRLCLRPSKHNSLLLCRASLNSIVRLGAPALRRTRSPRLRSFGATAGPAVRTHRSLPPLPRLRRTSCAKVGKLSWPRHPRTSASRRSGRSRPFRRPSWPARFLDP